MVKVTALSIIIWMLAAAVVGIVTYLLWEKGKIRLSTAIIFPILVFYLSFALTLTIIERASTEHVKYELDLFWTYKAIQSGLVDLITEIVLNVGLFIPIGLMVSALLRRRPWLSLVIGLLLSAGIEAVQFFTHRGLFELDDVVHNSFGALIGLLLYLIMKKLRKKRNP